MEKMEYKLTPIQFNSNVQGSNLGCSVCLLEFSIYLAQRGDLGESGEGILSSQSN